MEKNLHKYDLEENSPSSFTSKVGIKEVVERTTTNLIYWLRFRKRVILTDLKWNPQPDECVCALNK